MKPAPNERSEAPSRRPRRWLVIVVVVLGVFVVVRGLIAWSDWNGKAKTAPVPRLTTAFATRIVEAGGVTVKIQPKQLDASGAVFSISFDTHSVDLGFDVARQARLVVGTDTWTTLGWTGDGPGGHHRQGHLRFAAPLASAQGTATLTIGGLPKPVAAAWQIGS